MFEDYLGLIKELRVLSIAELEVLERHVRVSSQSRYADLVKGMIEKEKDQQKEHAMRCKFTVKLIIGVFLMLATICGTVIYISECV